MSKVHIALVGGQPMPIYLGIKYADPDRVILVHSSNSSLVANRVKSEYPNLEMSLEELDPVDICKIETFAKGMMSDYNNDEISINISGGTKPWTYYFSNVFSQAANATLFYVDQNCKAWNLKTKECSLVEFDLAAQFRILGNPLQKYIDYKVYTKEDFDVVRKVETIRSSNYAAFNNLLTAFPTANAGKWKNQLDYSSEGKFVLPDNSYVEFFKPDLVRVCLTNKKKGYVTEEFQSDHAVQICFHANWFELKVAKILSKWDKAKAIYHNCVFPLKPNVDKNEVDLIVDTGSKLLFVECKTQINQSTDIDKFRTVLRNYGGQGSKGIFIIQNKFTELTAAKCKESELMSFSLGEYSQSSTCASALYKILDEKLFDINIK